jgi:thioredoxin 1
MVYFGTMRNGTVVFDGDEKPAEGSRLKIDPIEQVTATTYRSFVCSSHLAIIHFWASWDNIHQAVLREVNEALKGLQPPVRFAMWDTDDAVSAPLLNKFQIATVPTIYFYKDGKLAEKQIGFRTADKIKETLDKLRKV